MKKADFKQKDKRDDALLRAWIEQATLGCAAAITVPRSARLSYRRHVLGASLVAYARILSGMFVMRSVGYAEGRYKAV